MASVYVMRSKLAFSSPSSVLRNSGSYHLARKSRSGAAGVDHLLHLALEERLGQILIVVQVAEGHLRLDHVELRQMARRVRILGAEGGSEGVDIGEGVRENLRLQLPADRQVGALAEEILREIRRLAALARAIPDRASSPGTCCPRPRHPTAEITGVCTYRKPRSWKNLWIAAASALRTRKTAPKVLERVRRWPSSRSVSSVCFFFCSG